MILLFIFCSSHNACEFGLVALVPLVEPKSTYYMVISPKLTYVALVSMEQPIEVYIMVTSQKNQLPGCPDAT